MRGRPGWMGWTRCSRWGIQRSTPGRRDAGTLAQAPGLRLISRFGAGYETINLDDCTLAGVVVTNTPAPVRRPLAAAGLTMLLALAHHLLAKDRITRTSQWQQREHHRGAALDGAVLGIVGFGSVGVELARKAAPLGLQVVGNNRSGRSPAAEELGVQLMGLDELLCRSDFVVLCAALTPETANLIDARNLELMKPSAFLINIGRGKLVDTAALRTALRTGQIASAGLDAFEPEPLDPDGRAAPDGECAAVPALAVLDGGLHRDVAAAALGSIISVAAGHRPANVLNPEVFETAAWAGRNRTRTDSLFL